MRQELALWKGGVTVPTIEDCWRKFRTAEDAENYSGYDFSNEYGCPNYVHTTPIRCVVGSSPALSSLSIGTMTLLDFFFFERFGIGICLPMQPEFTLRSEIRHGHR